MKIRVEITEEELSRLYTWHTETWAISKLKSKGIPIKGTLIYNSVDHGTLNSYKDITTGNTWFVWDDGKE